MAEAVNQPIVLFNNKVEIHSTKRSKTVGIGILCATLLWVVLSVNTFISQDFWAKWILLAFALICPFVLGLCIAYTIVITDKRLNEIFHLVCLFLMPFVTMTMTEALNDVFVYNMTYLGVLGNYIVIGIAYFLIYAFSGSLKWAYLIVNPILYGFALAHSYIMDFRGTPFIPMDFLSITTAAGVANTYNFMPSYKVIMGTFVLIFIMIIGIKTKTPKFSLLTKAISRSFTGAFSIIVLVLFFFTSVFADMGVRPDFWNQIRGYRNYGFVFSFFSNTKYLYMSEPDGYNYEDVRGFVENKVNNEETEKPANPVEKKPNVICIMNESLSDLSVLGNLETNKAYMPYLNSLKENTIRGNLYVPVIGAGTSNTEFEFLTGHSMAFLPAGSNAYMLYLKNRHVASLVSTMEAQGYSSYALHPYFATGWERVKVYNNLGFDKFTALENILQPELLEDYKRYNDDPDKLQQVVSEEYSLGKMLIRQYVSDEYNYDLLIRDYENRDKSKPYFAFNVTMQNHGGYTTGCTNFKEDTYATNVKEDYIKANKYLSLLKYSDNAFKGLIEYFKNVKEPTVICMFGDHQPSIEKEFIQEVMGVKSLSSLTPEQEQQRYCTPFYIWANYDIEEQYIEKLSANYLSSYVLKTAGLELTDYNKYLIKLSEKIPVVNNIGYIDSENNYYTWNEESVHTAELKEYEKIQYNNIFDREHVDIKSFYLEGYTIPEDVEE